MNKPPKQIATKFGRATLHKRGYYIITSSQEGNIHKRLHRLIYEDYYGVTVMPWASIHHIDHIKHNNDIRNLQCLSNSEHVRLHKTKNHPTIIKKGLNSNKKQNYGLYKNKSLLKRAIKIKDLIAYAKELGFEKVEVLGEMKYLE